MSNKLTEYQINTQMLKDASMRKRITEGKTVMDISFDFGASYKTYNQYLNGDLPKHKLKPLCDFLGLKVADVLED